MKQPIKITVYRWGGSWGPFSVKIPCGECTLTKDIILDTLAKELNNYDVEVETLDWLSHWWKPLLKGGWHAPIIMVNDKIISQGEALNRGVLTQAVIEAGISQRPIEGARIYGKEGCPFCVKAKDMMNAAGLDYEYLDVVAEPNALYEMLGLVKPIVGPKTPITVPQIWLDGQYVGGAQELEVLLSKTNKATAQGTSSENDIERNDLRLVS